MKSRVLLATIILFSAASAAQTTESFGSDSYTVDYSSNSTFTFGNETNHLEDVELGASKVSFTGFIELPDTCIEVDRKYEKTDSELVFKVDTYSTGENCTQPSESLYQKYRFEMSGEKPFRLEVRHNGMEVRTVETTDYSPGSNNGGFIAAIINFFTGLI